MTYKNDYPVKIIRSCHLVIISNIRYLHNTILKGTFFVIGIQDRHFATVNQFLTRYFLKN